MFGGSGSPNTRELTCRLSLLVAEGRYERAVGAIGYKELGKRHARLCMVKGRGRGGVVDLHGEASETSCCNEEWPGFLRGLVAAMFRGPGVLPPAG